MLSLASLMMDELLSMSSLDDAGSPTPIEVNRLYNHVMFLLSMNENLPFPDGWWLYLVLIF